jgi:hypothetical protein
VGSTQFRGYPRVDDGSIPDGQAQINALADALDVDVQALAGGYKLAAIVQLTSSGNFTKGSYAGIKAIEVEVVGAGGGSGFAAATSGAQISFGEGGGGGGYGHGFILAGALATSETVTVGVGGVGGTSGTPDATDGGGSSFGGHVTAGGGGGGNDSGAQSTAGSGFFTAGAAGAAGAGTACDISVPGEGDGGIRFESGFIVDVAGLRGNRSGGPYGAAVQNSTFASGTGGVSQTAAAGVGIGGGARGPRNLTSGSSQNGAAGANGRVIVRVYI